jgi:hypothetical protein
MNKSIQCIHCGQITTAYLSRNITHAGVSNVFWKCERCNKNANGSAKWIPHQPIQDFGIDIDILPIEKDDRKECCVVCGELGTHYHHWAPRHLFGDEADKWPGAFLCVKHHVHWHKLLTPKMSGNGREK